MSHMFPPYLEAWREQLGWGSTVGIGQINYQEFFPFYKGQKYNGGIISTEEQFRKLLIEDDTFNISVTADVLRIKEQELIKSGRINSKTTQAEAYYMIARNYNGKLHPVGESDPKAVNYGHIIVEFTKKFESFIKAP